MLDFQPVAEEYRREELSSFNVDVMKWRARCAKHEQLKTVVQDQRQGYACNAYISTKHDSRSLFSYMGYPEILI